MAAQVDHLVVAAASLDEGVAWCEATLGVVPANGGRHPLMGTHNRLIKIASPGFAQAYLEIIAIEPGVSPTRTGELRRWFDLDDAQLQARLEANGPTLIHFVARVPSAEAATRALAALRIDRGRVLEASRDTPAGRLSWQITVRDDGQRLYYGALPTLIEWGPVHPADGLPASPLQLRELSLQHPRADALAAAIDAVGLPQVDVASGPPRLLATLDTPRGTVMLDSAGA